MGRINFAARMKERGKLITMSCSQVKRDIALWVGQDLDDAERRVEIRRHVSDCPGCRAHFQQMKRTLHVLERADRAPTFRSTDSLWPAVANRIAQPHPVVRPGRFNGWMPFIAMTSACLTLMLVVNDRPATHEASIMRGPTALLLPVPLAEPISIREDHRLESDLSDVRPESMDSERDVDELPSSRTDGRLE